MSKDSDFLHWAAIFTCSSECLACCSLLKASLFGYLGSGTFLYLDLEPSVPNLVLQLSIPGSRFMRCRSVFLRASWL